MASTLALLTCLGVTCYMTGLIWFVQRVHYPLLERIEPGSFGRYHAEHVRRTGPVVALAMLAELGSSVALLFERPIGAPSWLAIAGLVAAVTTWASTAWLQVPLHRRLASGFDPTAHRRLVLGNWIRTASWTAHALIVLAMTGLALP